MQRRSLISLVVALSANAIGTFRTPVQLLERVFMKGWIGLPTTSPTRPKTIVVHFFCVLLVAGCRGKYYQGFLRIMYVKVLLLFVLSGIYSCLFCLFCLVSTPVCFVWYLLPKINSAFDSRTNLSVESVIEFS